ncbi:Hypothetical predicted protein [Paramuricea clavata]|uniref:Uncharacterized protein n=1 Tax=Paramuricea clavata TaxID=317549 RepID=A0A6S7IFV7_PARCT|nr:Hypothetical predicted protein [Paramuricea clavata]
MESLAESKKREEGKTQEKDVQWIEYDCLFTTEISNGHDSSPHYACKPDDTPNITDLNLTVYKIQAVLEALDVTKATGSDGIPARLLKETAEVIAPSLCCLFNKSLNTGTLPDEWKLANVVPVHKKGNAEYREL